MIVPGGDHGGGFTQFLKSLLRFQLVVFLFEELHVLGVAIDVVTQPDEDVGLVLEDGLIHRALAFAGIVAGTEGDLGDGLGPVELTGFGFRGGGSCDGAKND